MNSKSKILVVEDEIVIAMDIQRILIEMGYAVPTIVSTGAEAIWNAAEQKPDLVLMDIMIQGNMDGIEAAQEIGKRTGIPVIFLTSYADQKTLERAKSAEPLGFLIKPFETRDLNTTIEIALYKSQMEKKLRENETWLSTLLQSMGEAVIATDKLGNIRFMNPCAQDLMGTDQKDAIGKNLLQVLHLKDEDGEDLMPELIGEFGSIPQSSSSIFNLKKSDQKVIPIELSSSIIRDKNGILEGNALIFRDITEKKEAQRLTLEHEKMEALGVMASGVAHEINNPLSIILAKSFVIRTVLENPEIPTGTSHQIIQGIDKIEAMVKKISKIVQDMLSFARADGGGAFVLTSLSQILQEASDTCAEKLSVAQIALRLPESQNSSVQIECHPSQISQIFVNLFNNARDAISQLDEKWIQVEVRDCNNCVEVAVSDSGNGIPEEIRAKILEPFFSTKPVGQGTGIGLSITKTILQAHRGRIEIDPDCPNTRFLIILPKKQNSNSQMI